MKKILFILLVALGLQSQAQVMYCDSISYATSSTINYPFGVTGLGTANVPGTVTWTWTVCNSNMCYSSTGVSAGFGQVSLTDTLKVCYDVYIDINGFTYTCSNCDTLVYNPNSYQWELMTALPTSIEEVNIYSKKCLKMYDLLGREIFEVPIGTIYIKNRKKYIK